MSRGPYKSKPRKFKSTQSSPNARGQRSSYQRQEGPKTFKVGEIEYPYLRPESIIKWLDDTVHINEINDLTRWTESALPPTPKVVPTPLVGNSDQKKLKLATDAAQNAIAKEEKEKHTLAYNLTFGAIPKVYQMAWSKGITSAKVLRDKIKIMCSYKQDTLLKIYFKAELDKLRLRSNGLLDMSNYENSFLELVQQYVDAGGTITMDEQVAMLRTAIFSMSASNPTYRKEFIDCLLNDGPHMTQHPSTRGWSFEDIMKRMKDRNYAEIGPDHQTHSGNRGKEQSSKRRDKPNTFKASTSYSNSRKVQYDKREDYNQKDRVQVRNNYRSGAYGHRENPKKAQTKMFSKGNYLAKMNKTNTVQSNYTKRLSSSNSRIPPIQQILMLLLLLVTMVLELSIPSQIHRIQQREF
jgi:hypothetical protein